MNRNDKDLLLIEAIKTGDARAKEKAYNDIFEFYRSRVKLNIVTNFSLKDDEVEDIVSLTFIKAFKEGNIESFVPNNKFSTWLYKIARNNANDLLRKTKKHDVISEEDYFYSEDEDGNSTNKELYVDERTALNEILDAEKVDAIEYCIGKLTPTQAELIRYDLYDQMNDEEIAVVTGRKPVSIRATISIGKKNLREHLKNMGMTPA